MGITFTPGIMPANGNTADGDDVAQLFTDCQLWSGAIPRSDLQHNRALVSRNYTWYEDVVAGGGAFTFIPTRYWANQSGYEIYLEHVTVYCASVPAGSSVGCQLQREDGMGGWADMLVTVPYNITNATQATLLYPAMQNRYIADTYAYRWLFTVGVAGGNPCDFQCEAIFREILVAPPP